MKKLLILFILGLFLISLISASNSAKITAYVVVDNKAESYGNQSELNDSESNRIQTIAEPASDTAKGVLAVKCERENCTLIVKDIQVGNEAKRAYEVIEQTPVRLFGLIKKNMTITSYYDADTEDLLVIKKPWWAFLASGD